jgi:UDP-sugar pyrophosphorylase
MRADQISFVVQAGVPALSNQEAHFVLDNNEILCKPHGHGDVHSLLARSGLPKTWLDRGLKRVFFFQDTNAFALRTLLPALGSAASRNLDVCSTCVERRAGEAMGALCLLKKGTLSLLKNVEYNQLEPLLLSTTGKGDVDNPSPYPGNTNQLIISLSGEHGYVATLERTGGNVPEFVNPKFNANRTFKKPARLECMMQDYPQLLEGGSVGFVTLSRKAVREYAPVKNSPESAIDKVKQGLDAHSASSGEADFYALHGDFLRCGVDVVIGGKEPGVYRGLSIEMPPRIVLSPSFALIEDDVIKAAKGVTVHKGATLVIEGEGSVELEDVIVEEGSALRISTVKGVALRVLGLNVANAGYRVEAPGVTKAEVIRGFRIVKRDETHLKFEEPGSYAVAPLDLSSDDEDEDDASRVPLILGAAAVAVLAVLLMRYRRIS